MQIIIFKKIHLKKKEIKNFNIFIFKSNLQIFKIKLHILNHIFYNYFLNLISLKKKVVVALQNYQIAHAFVFNFKARQIKVNYLDITLNKKYSYSTGLVLKILDLFKKSSRRSTATVKHLIGFILKKYAYLTNNPYNKPYSLDSQIINKELSCLLILKGFRKGYLRLLNTFKHIILKFNFRFFYFMPLKTFNLVRIKKIRSIKRRITKKLIDFNKI